MLAHDNRWIETSTGMRVNVFRPKEHHFSLVDIARGLSNLCRFAGQIPYFYSVAQHSVLMSYRVPPEFAWDAAMHDAAEALVCDIPRPIKQGLPDYLWLIAGLEARLAEQYGLSCPLPECVLEADARMVLTEGLQMGRNVKTWELWEIARPYDDLEIVPWAPQLAYEKFLQRVLEVFPRQEIRDV